MSDTNKPKTAARAIVILRLLARHIGDYDSSKSAVWSVPLAHERMHRSQTSG